MCIFLQINKLEKDLEEKTRLYLNLEAFLKAVQSIMANKVGVLPRLVLELLEFVL